MNLNKELKHLDRAFTPTPPELASRVETAFRKGEREMKKRYKFMTALSVAALLAILFAALALASGQLAKSRVDRVVVAPRGGGGRGSASEPESPTPIPTATPEPTAEAAAREASVEEPAYYATFYGQCFHLDENCSGMRNALPCALNTVLVMGKRACPICVGEDSLSDLRYYATSQGTYYHIFEDCSWMLNASPISKEAAEASGKLPCPVCQPAENVYRWATSQGTYYHSERECMGMRNARVYTQVCAEHLGKGACPICLDGPKAAAMGILADWELVETASEANAVRGTMTAQRAYELVLAQDQAAKDAREFWIYPSSEAEGAWVFYATGYSSKEALFRGAAWYVGDQSVCLGRSDAVSDWSFFTTLPDLFDGEHKKGEIYARNGMHVAYGPELFASVIRTDGRNRVHVWKLGEDGAPVELDAGDKLCTLHNIGGLLCGLTNQDYEDWCFLREHQGMLCQVCAQPVEISEVETLPGGAALLDELRREYTVTGCLYRSMGADTDAEVITVNLERDGAAWHTYLFRETSEEELQCMHGWENELVVDEGKGSIVPDAGLPNVTSGGIEVTYKSRTGYAS